jgi:hypothetical protein
LGAGVSFRCPEREGAERRKTRLLVSGRSVVRGAPQTRGRGNVFRRSTAGLLVRGAVLSHRSLRRDASANQWRAPVVEPDSHPGLPSARGTFPRARRPASRPTPPGVPDNAPLVGAG